MHFILSTAFALLSLQSFSAIAQSIDPSTIDKTTKQAWCTSQIAACPLLCLQGSEESAGTRANTCDPDTLAFSCVCANGISPNASEYSQTIPYFECTEVNNECVNNCGSNPTCQSACRSDNPCGAQDPTRVNTTSEGAMTATSMDPAASTGSRGIVYTGLGGGAAATPTTGSGGNKGRPNAGNSALDLGKSYGIAIVFGGLFVGFALIL